MNGSESILNLDVERGSESSVITLIELTLSSLDSIPDDLYLIRCNLWIG
jgi:hypothetical protein